MSLSEDAVSLARKQTLSVEPRTVAIPDYTKYGMDQTYADLVSDYIAQAIRRQRVYENSVAFVLFGVHL